MCTVEITTVDRQLLLKHYLRVYVSVCPCVTMGFEGEYVIRANRIKDKVLIDSEIKN